MKTNNLKLSLMAMLFLSSVIFLAGCSTESIDELKSQTEVDEKSSPASQNQLLASIKSVTSKYHRFEAAEADGYILDPHCAEAPGIGAMGFHAVNYAYVDGQVNPLEPEVLVYEPMKNGKLRLVAIEYLVVAEPWDAVNNYPPMLGNQVFNDHRPEGSGGPPFPHYQLHVWVWKNNPLGMYFPFNPNVSCEYSYLFVD